MKPTVVLSLSSPKPSHEWDFGQKVLQVLYDADPRLVPDRVGSNESDFRKKLPCETVADVQPLWACFDEYDEVDYKDGWPTAPLFTLFWKRTRPLRASGAFWFAWCEKVWDQKMPSGLVFTADYAPDIDFIDIFRKWCALYEPRQAYLHYINKTVRDEPRPALERMAPPNALEGKVDRFLAGFMGPLRDEKTYDLGCVNFFSKEWFGETTIAELKDAGLQVEEFDNGAFIFLAPQLAALETTFDEFVQQRSLAKSIIGASRFEIGG